jgi:hypothetical protein
MIGIRRHLREPAFAQELLRPDSYSVHGKSGAFGDETEAYRIRSYVLVTTELDKVEDVFCLRKVGWRHAVARH